MTRFATRSALLGLLALAGCSAAGGSARECVYDRPLIFSADTIKAMQPDERRDLLNHNRNNEAICTR